MPKFLSVLGFIVVLFGLVASVASAQQSQNISLGIANNLKITDKDVKDGDIIASNEKGYFLSRLPYDPLVIGVVSLKPAVAIHLDPEEDSGYPVVTSGNVEVNVTSANGNIEEGDLITSSPIPGAGMKAKETGYVIGRALEPFVSDDPKSIGSINVALNLHYSYSGDRTANSIKDIFNLSLLATYESPSAVFKYVVAGFVIVLAFVLGLISFGRVARTGVEALGRNPLAGKMIQVGIVMNVLITIAIIAAGFGLAFVIIRL